MTSRMRQLRCTYVPLDHRDEVASPLSLAFSANGRRLYAGFEHCLRVFATDRPGRDCTVIPTTPTRRAKEGQKGTGGALA
jgi:telomerase Cajal body protein 1